MNLLRYTDRQRILQVVPRKLRKNPYGPKQAKVIITDDLAAETRNQRNKLYKYHQKNLGTIPMLNLCTYRFWYHRELVTKLNRDSFNKDRWEQPVSSFLEVSFGVFFGGCQWGCMAWAGLAWYSVGLIWHRLWCGWAVFARFVGLTGALTTTKSRSYQKSYVPSLPPGGIYTAHENFCDTCGFSLEIQVVPPDMHGRCGAGDQKAKASFQTPG